MKEDSPQGICDNPAEKMLIEFAESGCPEVNSKAKDLVNSGKIVNFFVSSGGLA